jgi:hypothetical protein
MAIIQFRDLSITAAMRVNFYVFIELFLPYFAISRTIETKEDFKKIFYAMICSAVFLSFVGVFEALKGWHLYVSLVEILKGEAFAHTGLIYKWRHGLLRVFATFFNSIIFGVYLVVVTGIAVFLKNTALKKQALFYCVIALLGVAAICTTARAPIAGYVVFFLFFTVLAMRNAIKMVPFFLVVILILSFLPITQKIVSSLPFVGHNIQNTVEYRQHLWNNAVEVIKSGTMPSKLLKNRP